MEKGTEGQDRKSYSDTQDRKNYTPSKRKQKRRLVPLLTCEKLIKQVGVKRVSEKAKELLSDVLEEYAKNISEKAKVYAQHSGKKTITENDIRLVLKDLGY